MSLVKNAAVLSAVCVALFLTGCATPARYKAGEEAVKGSPALKAELMDRCVRGNRSTEDQKRRLKAYMNLAPGQDAVKVACSRITNGIASGRLSYDDILSMNRPEPSVRAWTILKGR